MLSKFLNKNEKRATLMRKANPVSPLSKDENCEAHGISTFCGSTTQSRKLSSLRRFQEDEYEMFKKEGTVTSLSKFIRLE